MNELKIFIIDKFYFKLKYIKHKYYGINRIKMIL